MNIVKKESSNTLSWEIGDWRLDWTKIKQF